MEKMEEVLLQWQKTEPERVSLSKLKTDPGLQPRAEEIVTLRRRPRLQDDSDEHIKRMRGVLEARKEDELEPLLVADINGALFVVDGHHRLRAYKLAQRKTLPARVRKLTFQQAALISKLVNLGGVRLPLAEEQARDAAWQYLAAVTHQGSLHLPSGESTRTVGARFGISHETVARMLRRLPQVLPDEYLEPDKDPGTGWPRWRYVKENCRWLGDVPGLEEFRAQRRAEKVAVQLCKLQERWGSEVVLRGCLGWLRASEVDDEAAEARQEAEAELEKELEKDPFNF